MPDRITVTSREGWLSRLGSSIGSVLFGLAIFVVAFPLLFWNEGRAVRTAKSLAEGSGVVVAIGADRVDAANDGRLVHVNGYVNTEETLTDDTFGVSEEAIKLFRDVEMYQWVERSSRSSEKKLGGSEVTTATYDYGTEWRAELVDSSRFQSPAGHDNPGALPFESKVFTASTVRLGAFQLSSSQVDRLQRSSTLPVEALPSPPHPKARVRDGEIFIGGDPSSPAVGDVRVQFRVVRLGPVSVVARQVGSTFEPYRASAGGSVFLLEESLASAEAMFDSAEASNSMLTWVLRVIGFLMMFFGIATVFRPIAVAGDVVPLFGRLLGAGTGLFAGFGAAFFASITVGVAWIVYRPLVGLALLALGIGAVWLLARFAGRSTTPAPPPLPASEAR